MGNIFVQELRVLVVLKHFNYKKFFSIVLMAISVENDCNVAIDVGTMAKKQIANYLKEFKKIASIFQYSLCWRSISCTEKFNAAVYKWKY